MSKQFWAVIAVIIVIVGGIVLIAHNKKSSTTTNVSVSATNHVQGSTSSGVSLVEYGDFECPACENYYPLVQAVVSKYSSKITYQFRNFPLTQIHPNAFAGSRAVEAAAAQGKFWEMYDALYNSTNWNAWSTSSNAQPYFQQYAKTLGLNVTQFNTDFASSHVNDLIQADMKAGSALNLDSTPTFFLDGKKIVNAPQNLDDWSKLIDAAIASKQTAQ